MITDRHTSKSRGFGFVTFTKVKNAEKAIAAKLSEDGRDLCVFIEGGQTYAFNSMIVRARQQFGSVRELCVARENLAVQDCFQ